MRLYLSSFRVGDHPENLIALVGEDSRRTVVIANAMDDAPPDVRRAGVELELAALADLGFDAVELDLRDYFAQQQRLRRELAGVSMAWLRGGNVFMLRYALYRSGGDVVLYELLAANALVYAGYSAGPCVLSPSLRGLELVDDADAVGRFGDPVPSVNPHVDENIFLGARRWTATPMRICHLIREEPNLAVSGQAAD